MPSLPIFCEKSHHLHDLHGQIFQPCSLKCFSEKRFGASLSLCQQKSSKPTPPKNYHGPENAGVQKWMSSSRGRIFKFYVTSFGSVQVKDYDYSNPIMVVISRCNLYTFCGKLEVSLVSPNIVDANANTISPISDTENVHTCSSFWRFVSPSWTYYTTSSNFPLPPHSQNM